MFGIGSTIKIVATLIIVLVIAGGLWYVTGLRADLAIAQENTKKMEQAVQQQQAVIEQIKADTAAIQQANADLNAQIATQTAELNSLKDRFARSASGKPRDFGNIAATKPVLVERIINKATAKALRCLELASGAPHTEEELNATKPSEINRECPALANPNYTPASN